MSSSRSSSDGSSSSSEVDPAAVNMMFQPTGVPASPKPKYPLSAPAETSSTSPPLSPTASKASAQSNPPPAITPSAIHPSPVPSTTSMVTQDTSVPNSTVRLIPQLKTEVIFKEPDPKPRISMEEASSKIKSKSFYIEQASRNLGKHTYALEWSDLDYEVEPRRSVFDVLTGKRQKRQILQGLFGYCAPGEMLCIVGSSGCGKTTLLDILADRIDASRYTGDVKVNGKPRNSASFHKIAAYIKQHDLFLGSSTPRETIEFAAGMRMSSRKDADEINTMVNSLIQDLGLSKCQHTRIGDDLVRGISGGERKRTSIAQELTNEPNLIFLDEPTTGLDSATALQVIGMLRELANRNCTVVCTLHQPRADIFALFDRLLLMDQGKVMYFGRAVDAIYHFQQLGYECPRDQNPPDFFLDVIKKNRSAVSPIPAMSKAGSHLSPRSEKKRLSRQLPQQYDPDYGANWFTQFWYLLLRAFRDSYRNPLIALSNLLQYLFTAALAVFAWWHLHDDEVGVRNRLGVLIWIMISLGFTELFSATTYFPRERTLFNREQDARLYTTSAYVVATSVAHLPHELIGAIGTVFITFWALDFTSTVANFWIYVVVCVLVVQTSAGLGMALSMATPSYLISNLVANFLFDLWVLFSGYFLESKNIPPYFKWAEFSSFIKFANNAIVQSDFKDRIFRCTAARACQFDATQLATITAPNGTNLGSTTVGQISVPCFTCVFPSGQSVIQQYGFDRPDGIGLNIGLLVILAVLFRILSYLALRFIHAGRA